MAHSAVSVKSLAHIFPRPQARTPPPSHSSRHHFCDRPVDGPANVTHVLVSGHCPSSDSLRTRTQRLSLMKDAAARPIASGQGRFLPDSKGENHAEADTVGPGFREE